MTKIIIIINLKLDLEIDPGQNPGHEMEWSTQVDPNQHKNKK
jgi:hypothetical protein